MKLKLLTILILSSCMLFTACSTKHKRDDMSVADANAAYHSLDAQSTGLGEETTMGDASQSIDNRIYYFDFDSNIVHDTDKPAIVANAKKLSADPALKAIVEGHTDPRGSREYNIGLGERRAKAVAQVLMDNGVDRSQMRIVSYGAQKLASSGHTETDYQLDRRGVLDYLQ